MKFFQIKALIQNSFSDDRLLDRDAQPQETEEPLAFDEFSATQSRIVMSQQTNQLANSTSVFAGEAQSDSRRTRSKGKSAEILVGVQDIRDIENITHVAPAGLELGNRSISEIIIRTEGPPCGSEEITCVSPSVEPEYSSVHASGLLVKQMIEKLDREPVEGVLIVRVWTAATWWGNLMAHAKAIHFLPEGAVYYPKPLASQLEQTAPSWRFLAVFYSPFRSATINIHYLKVTEMNDSRHDSTAVELSREL
ncbi:hypothetical protein SARC_00641 [Sphaeroforma arctica JP610]|uniref:Uncharacterized protein n=1 Tax=Sphaeroforma arctica JP610 TaxID=667725 RepID=A0A0L0GE19_9EUKA|nr:hypothetical protein SARC_00641 [Sphaeroforma arctica JP610]KNC87255.1 hypothetical protein SARC_00641 [Sphaeroforma arctica JP610]|eukprot:XP_014161157.1 hypothetical protein SARC_00641 [Sphaeroforma arctica JP610]